MTKKKKGALLISALALIAVIVVGGTLAYFTSQDTAQNVFTMGKVDGELTETSTANPGEGIKAGEKTEDGYTYNKVMPGDKLSKEPVVSITNDSEPAYVRVRMSVNGTNNTTIPDAIKNRILSSECLDIDTTNWVKGNDGAYYYQSILSNTSNPVKNTTEPVFKVVTFDGSKWGNELNGLSFTIDLTADIIQAENFTPEISNGQIVGWNNVTIPTPVAP